jgi:hypothetical protein
MGISNVPNRLAHRLLGAHDVLVLQELPRELQVLAMPEASVAG